MNDRKNSIRSYFDQVHKGYGEMYEKGDNVSIFPSGPVRMQKSLALIQKYKQSGTVLDLGCGNGVAAVELAKLGYSVTGIDISENMVIDARELAANAGFDSSQVNFEVGDVEKVEAEDSSVDIVLSLGVIEYLPEDDAFMANIKRVLRPDGVAVIAFRNRLFNLSSLNTFTKEELESGTVSMLLEEFANEAKTGVKKEVLDEYYSALTQTTYQPTAIKQAEEAEFRFRHPVKLRQHLPREIRDLSAKYGFSCIETRYFHFHPFPPIFEQENPDVFNRIALEMEALDQTPIASAMASGIVVAIKRD